MKNFFFSPRGNDIPFNADLTDQNAGWSRVVPGCGGSRPHPISNYLESKFFFKKKGELEMPKVLTLTKNYAVPYILRTFFHLKHK